MDLTKTSLMIPRDLFKQARMRALEEGISFGELARRAIKEYLAKGMPKKKGG